jgi:hypothetical protein
MFDYVLIKHKQMSFVSNGGKFKLYTVLNSLIFPTPTQPRISFDRAILQQENYIGITGALIFENCHFTVPGVAKENK